MTEFGDINELQRLFQECSVHDVYIDFAQLYPTWIPLDGLSPLLRGGATIEGRQLLRNNYGWIKRIPRGWNFRINHAGVNSDFLGQLENSKMEYGTVRWYEVAIELSSAPETLERLLTAIWRHAAIPYNRKGLLNYEKTLYIGNRSTRRRMTTYIAEPKRKSARGQVLRLQVSMRVPPGKSLMLSQLANIQRDKKKLTNIVFDNLLFKDFSQERLIKFFSRRMAGLKKEPKRTKENQREPKPWLHPAQGKNHGIDRSPPRGLGDMLRRSDIASYFPRESCPA